MFPNVVVAWRALKFYAICIQWAAKGTLSRANATWGLIGVPVIYGLGVYWKLGRLRIPDDGLLNVLLLVVATFVTAVVIFLVRLIAAPGKLYGDTQDKIATLEAQSTPLIKVSMITPTGVQIAKTKINNTWGPNSKWVQIRVESTTNVALENCAAHVTKLGRLKADGSYTDLVFEPVFCNWSQAEGVERKRIKIPGLVPQAANLFSLNDTPNPELVLEFGHAKFQLIDEMKVPGRYEIEIVISADNSASVKKYFLLDWGGSFETIKLSVAD